MDHLIFVTEDGPSCVFCDRGVNESIAIFSFFFKPGSWSTVKNWYVSLGRFSQRSKHKRLCRTGSKRSPVVLIQKYSKVGFSEAFLTEAVLSIRTETFWHFSSQDRENFSTSPFQSRTDLTFKIDLLRKHMEILTDDSEVTAVANIPPAYQLAACDSQVRKLSSGLLLTLETDTSPPFHIRGRFLLVGNDICAFWNVTFSSALVELSVAIWALDVVRIL